MSLTVKKQNESDEQFTQRVIDNHKHKGMDDVQTVAQGKYELIDLANDNAVIASIAQTESGKWISTAVKDQEFKTFTRVYAATRIAVESGAKPKRQPIKRHEKKEAAPQEQAQEVTA